MTQQLNSETPAATAVEADVLGACLSEGPGWWELVSRVSGSEPESLFFESSYRMVAKALNHALASEAGMSGVEDQLIYLGGNNLLLEPHAFLVQLQARTSITTIPALHQALAALEGKRALRRQLTELEAVRGQILTGLATPGQVSAELRRVSMDHAINRGARKMDAIIAELEEDNNPPWAVPTGLKELDRLLNGGFQPGRVCVIGARPKVGKTTAVLNFVDAAIGAGVIPLFVSLEMSELEVYGKLLSSMAWVPHHEVQSILHRKKRVKDLDPEEAEDFARARQELVDAQLHMAFVSDIRERADSIISMVMNMKAKYGEEARIIVFVDYLQLLVDNTAASLAQLSEMTRTFKLSALSLNIPIVLLSQISRAGSHGMPHPSQLRDSGTIEQDADQVILLHRKALDDDSEPPNIIDFWMPYNRAGQAGAFQANWAPEYSAITDLDPYNQRTDSGGASRAGGRGDEPEEDYDG